MVAEPKVRTVVGELTGIHWNTLFKSTIGGKHQY